MVKNDWTQKEIAEIYNQPLLELIYQAAHIHRKYNNPLEVQISTLLSIKTGGCTENCGYCSQSAENEAEVNIHPLLDVNTVVDMAKKAKEEGASRFCMGAAWREVRDNKDFDRVLVMIKQVNKLGMQVCCSLGMLTEEQAKKLSDAGIHTYNHNIDTSEDHYSNIISTRTYKDRLKTLENVRKAGIAICSGGIIGLGETHADRIDMLHTLSTLGEHPDSVPLNALMRIPNTPLEDLSPVPIFDMLRMIATSRVLMPKSTIRLSAGRTEMSKSDQALCFISGANSIFIGGKLLTASNPEISEDMQLLKELGLKPKEVLKKGKKIDTVEVGG